MGKCSLDSYNDKNLDKSTGFVNCKKGWTRLVAASDKVSVAGPWYSWNIAESGVKYDK